MKSLKHFIIPALFCLLAFSTRANNLQITSMTVNQNSTTGGTVTFTITWNNCWNLNGGTAPSNWDAAWVFVKWRLCTASPAVAFTHGLLSTTLSQHTIPSTLQPMTSLPGAGYYAAGGSAAITTTLDDANGIMLSPTTTGTQTSVTGTVTLYVSNLPANTSAVTVEVLGTEMVYVPQGPFTLGDGSANGSYYHFCTSAASSSPATVTSTNETATSSFYYMSSGTTTPANYAINVPAAWPKGYYAFYCMKYEITEDFYAQFLNTIGSSAAQNRYPGNSGTNRNSLSQSTSSVFSTTRPYRAQNWMSYADWEAVLDWSCLRPMTETEFEKACRGGSSTTANGAMANEFPWQSTSLTASSTFSGSESGTETLTGNPNCNANNLTFGNGDGGQGPVRAGIYATSSTGEQSAGSTYYGILDMGGNLREFVVEMTTTVANDTFQRICGDGALVTVAGQNGASNVVGDANGQYWPAPEGAVGANGSGTQCYGQRGGDWYAGPNSNYSSYQGMTNYYDPINTSSRFGCYYNTSYNGQYYVPWYYGQSRGMLNGGRGVR